VSETGGDGPELGRGAARSPLRALLLPFALALPALALCLPFSPLTDDPFPHLAGTGLAALCLAPAALFLLGGARGSPALPLFLAALAWAALSSLVRGGSDGLERQRSLVQLALLCAALCGGASLTSAGARRLCLSAVLVSSAWTGWALLGGWLRAEGSLAGVLGDTGSLSQAALPGAAIGATWAMRERGLPRLLGGLATLLFLVHAVLAPVLAGAHALFLALLLAGAREPRGRRGLFALAGLALLGPFLWQAGRELPGREPEGASADAPAPVGHSLGGLGVRSLVWKSSLAMLREVPLLGVGPGQFQAVFPLHRDAREIELSRHGICSEQNTEVEHAHNDWLQGFLELGLPGGLLIALGLALVARAAWRGLARPEGAALSCAALAMLVNAGVHSPFLGNAAAGSLAWAIFGALTGDGRRARLAGGVAGLAALAALPLAPGLLAHGGALAQYVRSARRIAELQREPETDPELASASLIAELERARATVQAALAAEPDSAPAREIAARLAREGQELPAWERVLAVRPNSVEAWEQSATEHARAGALELARTGYGRALALSPTHPRILKNLARLELSLGEPELGLQALERLSAGGCLEPAWLEGFGAELVLVFGRVAAAAELAAGRPLAELSPELLHARSREPGRDELSARAHEALAQLSWARQHASAGEFELAARNYRQALVQSRARAEAGAALFALELAAAELRAGRRPEALELARGRELDPRTRAELPPWALEALSELGLR
jgi:O-antigen ligase